MSTSVKSHIQLSHFFDFHIKVLVSRQTVAIMTQYHKSNSYVVSSALNLSYELVRMHPYAGGTRRCRRTGNGCGLKNNDIFVPIPAFSLLSSTSVSISLSNPRPLLTMSEPHSDLSSLSILEPQSNPRLQGASEEVPSERCPSYND